MSVVGEAMGHPVTLAFQVVPRRTIVLRGMWEGRKPDGTAMHGKHQSIELYGMQMNQNMAGGGGGSGSVLDFGKWLGEWVNQDVVIEASGMPEHLRLSWHLNDAFDRGDDIAAKAHDRELVLKHITEQTGLTWTEETRIVEHLFISNGQ